ncbi:CAP domain-containing protein [Leptothrix discophora]|uniref:CAP domain-containing protein n=1 Tax=Leptothrix discophora TaxID=89 RepID=A0ABT9FZI9_LEPDI|nr:CAP domain-containing protein [Leptothrix discophora]MDP4299633.1 CAP domain-containing protein [Leptothrix discophora]
MTLTDATENPATGHGPSPAAGRPSVRARTLLALSLAFVLVACGGGGSSGSADETAPAPAPAPVSQPTTQTIAGEAVVPVGEANCGLADMQSEITVRLSLVRAQTLSCSNMGTFSAISRPMRWNAQLYEAARVHSLDMANLAFFEHDGPGGDTPQSRVSDAGYAYATVSENLARGRIGPTGKPLDVDGVLELWKRSPPHCANLMSRRAVDVGLACVVNRSGVRYWTLVLASPVS